MQESLHNYQQELSDAPLIRLNFAPSLSKNKKHPLFLQNSDHATNPTTAVNASASTLIDLFLIEHGLNTSQRCVGHADLSTPVTRLVDYDYAPDLSKLHIDQILCVVVTPVCLDPSEGTHRLASIPSGGHCRFQGPLETGMASYSLLRVKVSH